LYNFVSFLCILQRTSWNNHPNRSKMSIRHHLWEISAVELVMWFIDWYVFNVTFNNISDLSVILTFFPLILGKSQNCHKWLINLITANILHHDSLLFHGKGVKYISLNLSSC
jgi:hypothetical protein